MGQDLDVCQVAVPMLVSSAIRFISPNQEYLPQAIIGTILLSAWRPLPSPSRSWDDVEVLWRGCFTLAEILPDSAMLRVQTFV